MRTKTGLTTKDQKYFRESREKIYFPGKTLEEVVQDREKRLPHFQKLLSFLRMSLKEQDFIAGREPAFSDYIIFGAFQWARIVSDFKLLNYDDPIFNWRERMLDLYGGLARNAKRVPR